VTESGHRFFGLYCKNSRDWMVVAEACFKTGVVVVPMYDTLGAETVSYIQGQTGLTTALCTRGELAASLLKKGCPFQQVLVSGALADGQRQQCRSAGFEAHTVSEAEAIGSSAMSSQPPLPSATYDDLAVVCYTSGTTGDPKGAMLTHGNLLAQIGAQMAAGLALSKFIGDNSQQQVHLSYLPLAHIFELVGINLFISIGGQIGFYQGDTLKIVEDLQRVRPTAFISVPRLFNKFYDKVLSGARDKGGLSAKLFSWGLQTKLDQFHKTGVNTHTFWDKLVFSKIAAGLGLDRCEFMVCGSAPISATVKDFFRVAFGISFIEGYGMTESATSGTITHPDDLSGGHVGMPALAVEVKLQDVPEMDYFSSSSPPRGEVCLRGPAIFKGYFMMPDKTAETVDNDGWLHTGDVGEWTPLGNLRIVDRKKNIFKLSQGEYVAAEKIENVLGRCPLVAQCFVYGDSLQSWLVAVVVVDPDEARAWAKAQGLPTLSLQDMLSQTPLAERLKAATLAQVVEHSKAAKLAGFEIPRRIALDAEPWTVESGLLTPTFKLKRNDAKKRYLAEITALYDAGLPSKL